MASDTILLKPTNSQEGRYTIFRGAPTQKDVQGKNRTVIPIFAASFFGNLLESKQALGDSVMFMADNGFITDGKWTLPGAQTPAFADVKTYDRGNLLVLSAKSDRIIESYRVLKILEALPAINNADLTDVRKAEQAVKDYQRFKKSRDVKETHGINLQDIMQFIKSLRQKTLMPKLPESVENYVKMIGKEKLIGCIQAVPTGMGGFALQPSGSTDLVIASQYMKADHLEYLLANQGELNELNNVRIYEKGYRAIEGVKLADAPGIISVSKSAAAGQNQANFSSVEFYDANFKEPKLRALVRKNENGNIAALALSQVRIGTRGVKQVLASPTEITYLQAVQPASKNGNVAGADVFFYNGRMDLKNPFKVAETVRIGHVAVFEKSADLTSEFRSPKDVSSFDGNVSTNEKAAGLFKYNFKNDVEAEAKRIEQENGVKVTGIVLSPIKVKTHIVDALVSIRTDHVGEYQLAATYLVEK